MKICGRNYAGIGQEINVLTYAKTKPDLQQSVVELLDHFELADEAGLHTCLVLELMWTDLEAFATPHLDPLIRMEIIRESVKQCIPILQVLEDHGIVHNGTFSIVRLYWLTLDLRGRNFLVTFNDRPITLDELLSLEKRDTRSEPDTRVYGHNYVDERTVIYAPEPVSIVREGEMVDLSKMKIKIADFGSGILLFSSSLNNDSKLRRSVWSTSRASKCSRAGSSFESRLGYEGRPLEFGRYGKVFLCGLYLPSGAGSSFSARNLHEGGRKKGHSHRND